MATIQIAGYVDESGCLHASEQTDLPAGEVLITIETITPEMVVSDDALWEKKFAETPDILDRLFAEAEAEIVDGKVADFDPDVDEI
jgi:hypothetical protein